MRSVEARALHVSPRPLSRETDLMAQGARRGGQRGGQRPAQGRGGQRPSPRQGSGQGRGAPARGGRSRSVDAPRKSNAEKSLGGEQVEGRQAIREMLIAGRRKVREIWIAGDIDAADVIRPQGRCPWETSGLTAKCERVAEDYQVPIWRVFGAVNSAAENGIAVPEPGLWDSTP